MPRVQHANAQLLAGDHHRRDVPAAQGEHLVDAVRLKSIFGSF